MRIGILGGTFDPVHNGHLHIARETARLLNLDQVLFMVSNYPPHKSPETVTDSFHRFAMVAITLLNEDHMLACGKELLRTGPSYTIETLEEVAMSHPGARICFVAGSDSLREIHSWKDCDRLFSEFCLVFVQRPGSVINLQDPNLTAGRRGRIQQVDGTCQLEVMKGKSYLLDLGAPPFSSSMIRHALREGSQLPADALQSQVFNYIRKNHLYEE